MKSALLKDITSAAKLTSIDVNKADCFVDYSKVDIGFITENAVKAVRKKVSDKQLLHFRLSCRNFLKAVVAKLLNKTAVQYPLGNNLAFLDPQLISDTDKNKTRLKSVLRLLVQCNRVAESEVDDILRQHSEYAASMIDNGPFYEF